jgi:hypothetical protein
LPIPDLSRSLLCPARSYVLVAVEDRKMNDRKRGEKKIREKKMKRRRTAAAADHEPKKLQGSSLLLAFRVHLLFPTFLFLETPIWKSLGTLLVIERNH